MTPPTWPVAPTIPTLTISLGYAPSRYSQPRNGVARVMAAGFKNSRVFGSWQRVRSTTAAT